MLPSSVRTALDLKAAIDKAPTKLEPLGSCLSMIKAWQDHYDLEVGAVKIPDAIGKLGKIYKEESHHMSSGYLPKPFDLTITYGEIDISTEIDPFGPPEDNLADNFYRQKEKADIREESAEFLKELFEGAEISGYGDVKSQSTRVNTEVRNAREIPTGHFTVSKSLYKDIEHIWSEHFLPGVVRVEPYKIHLYGPGGCFKPHWDTPEKGLVGTFLVGIGDCVPGDEGNLRVGRDAGMRAYPGSFVAFYPDVEHEVERLKGGYRGVIAFKIFRKFSPLQKSPSKPKPRTEFEKRVLERMKGALSKLTPPYGLLLQHRYSIETAEPSGMDNILHAAASALLTSSAEVHFIPVLLHFKSAVPEDWDYESSKPVPIEAHVFPLTELHIDALLAEIASNHRNPFYLAEREEELNINMPNLHHSKSNVGRKKRKGVSMTSGDLLSVDVSDSPYAWLRLCKNIPFYSLQKTADKITWSASFKEVDAAYLGNESRPDSADSIYLSYAMVVVPNKKRKRN